MSSSFFFSLGKNMQLYFVNEQSSEAEDNQVEDGVLSLPVITQSNYSHLQDMVS